MDVGTRVDYFRKEHHGFLLIGDANSVFPAIAYSGELQPKRVRCPK
ncbi:MAG TPA: hypothetical protein VNJ52_08415 [Patescibacteria group bacterium]|nr:hypothetical protein [Patescibacteria group bacterium]